MLSWCVLACLVVFLVTKGRAINQQQKAVSFGSPYGDVGPSDGALLIVEPREHALLGTVIKAFSERVPPDWVLYVVHGTDNAEYARAAVGSRRRVVFIPLNTSNLTAAQYNRLFTTPEFWHQIQAEHILVFQTDAMPCGPETLDMARYGNFGYIGCAYGNKAGARTSYWEANDFYGVGGLSLRRKSFMLECLQRQPHHEAEDVTFSNCVASLSPQRPTAQDLGDFCAQTGWGDPQAPPRSWGAHQIGAMKPKMLQQFLDYCPAARTLT